MDSTAQVIQSCEIHYTLLSLCCFFVIYSYKMSSLSRYQWMSAGYRPLCECRMQQHCWQLHLQTLLPRFHSWKCDHLQWVLLASTITADYITMRNINLSQHAQMVTSGWWMVQSHQCRRAERRSATTMFMAASVMTPGTLLTQVWFADSWDLMHLKVVLIKHKF